MPNRFMPMFVIACGNLKKKTEKPVLPYRGSFFIFLSNPY